jgi:hypothetical protein
MMKKLAYAQSITQELKHKKGIPTVIEYKGKKYILEPQMVNKHAKN